MWNILATTAQELSKSKVDFSTWVANCGRSVSHHSSFVPVLIRYKILSKVIGPAPKALVLSSETEKYRILESQGDKEEALKKITMALSLADDSMQCLSDMKVPTTCTEWCNYIDVLLKAFPSFGKYPRYVSYPHIVRRPGQVRVMLKVHLLCNSCWLVIV